MEAPGCAGMVVDAVAFVVAFVFAFDVAFVFTLAVAFVVAFAGVFSKPFVWAIASATSCAMARAACTCPCNDGCTWSSSNSQSVAPRALMLRNLNAISHSNTRRAAAVSRMACSVTEMGRHGMVSKSRANKNALRAATRSPALACALANMNCVNALRGARSAALPSNSTACADCALEHAAACRSSSLNSCCAAPERLDTSS